MTRILLIIFSITLLFSCSNNDHQVENNADISIDIKSFDTAIYFSGTWISENYLDNLNKFKSPKRAQDESEFIDIPKKTLEHTDLISNFHEGGNPLTVLKNKSKYELWEIQNDSITNKLRDIEIISSSKIKIGKNYFVKINPLIRNIHCYLLEELLFKGKYITENGTNIEFKNNGEVLGLKGIRRYEPILDYFDSGMQVDQIGLGPGGERLEWYGFKFNNDTLLIYKLNCKYYDSKQKKCVDVEFGEVAYRLRRKL